MENQTNNRLDGMDNIITAEEILRLNALSSKADKTLEAPNEMEVSEDVALMDTLSPLQTFTNSEFGSVRTIVQNNEPWFVGKDVCDCLGIVNHRTSLALLDDDEKGVQSMYSPGGNQEMIFINEYGLYTLILKSRKKEAKQFKRWITHEVIPSIRKHGAYLTQSKTFELMRSPEGMLTMLDTFKTVYNAKLEAEKKLIEAQPKINFANAISETDDVIYIGALAKLLKQNGVDIGRNRLFDWLKEHNFLCNKGEAKNIPTQYAMEQGLFRIKESRYFDSVGLPHLCFTTMVTPKGQSYFINKLACEFEA